MPKAPGPRRANSLTKRQQQMLDILKANGGRMTYQALAYELYPREEYPRAFNYSSNGGPPGCYMALSTMIRKMGLAVYSRGAGTCDTEIILPQSHLTQQGIEA